MTRFLLVLLMALIGVSRTQGDKPTETAAWIDSEFPKLLETYLGLHQNPEVSFQEEQTAAKIAELWEADGYQVTTKVGGHILEYIQ